MLITESVLRPSVDAEEVSQSVSQAACQHILIYIPIFPGAEDRKIETELLIHRMEEGGPTLPKTS